jgi:hypothetical protein
MGFNSVPITGKGDFVMNGRKLIFKFMFLCLFFLPVCAPIVCAQAPSKTPMPFMTIDAPQGGMIVYSVAERREFFNEYKECNHE